MPQVTVYRRPGCMFCEQVEEILTENDIPYRSLEISERDEQERLSRQHGALSFPLVLVDDAYIGGFTHIVQLHSEGRLRAAVLKEALPEAGSRPRDQPAKPGSLAGYAALGELLRRPKGSPNSE